MKTAVNVQQTTTGTGVGDLTLDAAATGFRAFSDAIALKPASGSQGGPEFVPYYIESADGTEWEFGTAEVQDDASNGALARAQTGATVFESSNADALVNFSAGTKTVRLITPPDVRDLARGCELYSDTDSMADATNLSWSTEISDTDDCWTVGDPTLIYVPLWASEIEVEFIIRHNVTAYASRPPVLEIQNFQFDDNDCLIQTVTNTANGWITGRRRFVVDPGQIVGNPIDNTDRASLRFRFHNPDGVSATTVESRVTMRVIR